MDDEHLSSADDELPSLGPRIQISDDQRQTAVDRSTDGGGSSTTADNDNTASRLHVPISIKGHSHTCTTRMYYCALR